MAARTAQRRLSRGATVVLLVLGPAVGLFASALLGTVAVPIGPGLRILAHQLSGGALYPNPCAGSGLGTFRCGILTEIVWQIYLPEALLAVVVGAALGMSGAALQGVFRNPLADPFLLGLSSGGTLGAATFYIYHIGWADADLYLPLFAFLGSTGTGLVVLAVARGRYGSVETVLLTGVALSNLLSAVLSLVLLGNPIGSEQVSFWLLGGLTLANWNADALVLGAVVSGGTVLALYGRELNLLQLGADVAQSAGVDAAATRVRVILLASLVTAVAVAFTGVIGFVGLVSPHVVRRLLGSDYRIVLPASAGIGALFVVGARDLSYLLFPGTLLPLGIFTAFAGVPFFLYLLFRQRQRATMGAM